MANYDVESHIPGTEKCFFFFFFWHPTHARTTRYEEAFLPEGKKRPRSLRPLGLASLLSFYIVTNQTLCKLIKFTQSDSVYHGICYIYFDAWCITCYWGNSAMFAGGVRFYKKHVIRTCLMYHAACKVEFQPFTRLYSQLTFFNFLKKVEKSWKTLAVSITVNGWNSTLQAAWYIRRVRIIWFLWTKPTIWLLILSFTQNIFRACLCFILEGCRSVTPLDAARVNRTIFHNHPVHWYYVNLIKGRYYIKHDINVRHGKQNPRRGPWL